MTTDNIGEQFDVAAENPYADIEYDSLPEWWQKAIEEFETYGLPTYYPPVFSDGALKFRVVEGLEESTDVQIDFIYHDSRNSGQWYVRIDRTPIGLIGQYRAKEGYSVFEMESDDFVDWVLDYLDSDRETPTTNTSLGEESS